MNYVGFCANERPPRTSRFKLALISVTLPTSHSKLANLLYPGILSTLSSSYPSYLLSMVDWSEKFLIWGLNK